MRSFLCKLAILSFLFVSIEGAADVVVDGIPHGDTTTHQQEFGHTLDAHNGEVSDAALDGEHCEHCCHGHCFSITNSVLTTSEQHSFREEQPPYVDQLPILVLTPPTPPPDAQIIS